MKRFRYFLMLGILLIQSCSGTATRQLPPELPRSVSTIAVEETPSLVLTMPAPAHPDWITPESTLQVPDPTQSPVSGPPAGFKEYRDSVSRVSIFLLENWLVTGGMEGQSVTFQSYPLDKYVGGEMLEPGDTKCDLMIRSANSTSVTDLVQQQKSGSLTTILSERNIILHSGKPGIRMEYNNMGPAVSLFTEINESVVVLTCFGDFTPFDEIAATLAAVE